ncbi:hypothetical protein KDA11_06130 [Candidatus Saccharibacteria bacterium]|nr:hypothetical protein [Candidatus Saccharibacteria bacterium]
MKQFVIKKVNQLGDKDPKYGATFWAEVEEQAQPVMFNLMQGNPQEGDRISSEEVLLKTSGKGTEYHRLKKVKLEEASPRLVSPTEDSLERRVAKLEEAVFGPAEDKVREVAQETKQAMEEETIDLSEIPF